MSKEGYLHNLVLLKVVLIHDSTPTIVTTTSRVNIVILKTVLVTTISRETLEIDILLAQTAVGVAVFVDGGSVVAAIGVKVSEGLELVLDLVGAVVETAHEDALGVLEGRCFDAESACEEGYSCETVHFGVVEVRELVQEGVEEGCSSEGIEKKLLMGR